MCHSIIVLQTTSSHWISWKSPSLQQMASPTRRGDHENLPWAQQFYIIVSVCRCILEWFRTKRTSPTTGAVLTRSLCFRSDVIPCILLYLCSPQHQLDPKPFSQKPDQPLERRASVALFPHVLHFAVQSLCDNMSGPGWALTTFAAASRCRSHQPSLSGFGILQ